MKKDLKMKESIIENQLIRVSKNGTMLGINGNYNSETYPNVVRISTKFEREAEELAMFLKTGHEYTIQIGSDEITTRYRLSCPSNSRVEFYFYFDIVEESIEDELKPDPRVTECITLTLGLINECERLKIRYNSIELTKVAAMLMTKNVEVK